MFKCRWPCSVTMNIPSARSQIFGAEHDLEIKYENTQVNIFAILRTGWHPMPNIWWDFWLHAWVPAISQDSEWWGASTRVVWVPRFQMGGQRQKITPPHSKNAILEPHYGTCRPLWCTNQVYYSSEGRLVTDIHQEVPMRWLVATDIPALTASSGCVLFWAHMRHCGQRTGFCLLLPDIPKLVSRSSRRAKETSPFQNLWVFTCTPSSCQVQTIFKNEAETPLHHWHNNAAWGNL